MHLRRVPYSLAAVLCCLFATLAAAQETPPPPALRPIGRPEALAERLTRGHALQFLALFPRDAGLPLVDPASGCVEVDGNRVATHLEYLVPEVALLFGITPPLSAGKHEVKARLALFGGTPLEVFQATAETTTTLLARPGARKTIVLQTPAGLPEPGYVFGPGLEDLFGQTGTSGTITLNLRTRSMPARHLAWSPGTWTEEFDPRTSQTITLTPLPRGVLNGIPASDIPPGLPRRTVQVLDPDGRPLPGALVNIEDTFHALTGKDGAAEIPLRPDRLETRLHLVARGFSGTRATVTTGDGPLPLKMRPPR